MISDHNTDNSLLSLLSLVKEADKQASLAAETAKKANALLQEYYSAIQVNASISFIELEESQKNLDIVQERVNQAKQAFLQLKTMIDEQRPEEDSTYKTYSWLPQDEIPKSDNYNQYTELDIPERQSSERQIPERQSSERQSSEQQIPEPLMSETQISMPQISMPQRSINPQIPIDPQMPSLPQPLFMPQHEIAAYIEPPRNRIAGILSESSQITLNNATPSTQLSPHIFTESAPVTKAALPTKQKTALWRKLWQHIRTPLIALAVVGCLRFIIFDVNQVQGESMWPTLNSSDTLITIRIAYKFHDPQRFDIIILDATDNPNKQKNIVKRLFGKTTEQDKQQINKPDKPKNFIKRIIGLPNEHIRIAGGKVFIRNIEAEAEEELQEEYLNNIPTSGDIDIIIPDGYYFVMGDNRPVSLDSRDDSVGFVAKENINGKAILRFYPLHKFGIL